MACTFPPELTEDDLLAILLDEADATLVAHVQSCEHCAARLEELRALSASILEELENTRENCPEPELIGDMLMGLLTPVVHQELLDHLQSCELCRQDELELRNEIAMDDFLIMTPKPKSKPRSARPNEFVAQIHSQPRYGEVRGQQAEVKQEPVRGKGTKGMRGEASNGIQHFATTVNQELSVSMTLHPGEADTLLRGTLYDIETTNVGRWTGAIVEVRHQEKLTAVTRLDETNSFECRVPNVETVHVRITSADGHSFVIHEVVIHKAS